MLSNDVLFDEMPGVDGALGVITLHRPQALNALNREMILAIQHQLNQWADRLTIKAVVIRASEGRAFCAGGDLRSLYQCMQRHDASMTDFFCDEYRLNRTIFHYPKPYIALLNGITMGGGVGISIHGSHRVATENMSFAMPETKIGFFPDVGGTYFLSHLPEHIGFYLGLTGQRLESDDCVALGVAQYKIQSRHIDALLAALCEHSLVDHPRKTVSHLLNAYKEPINPNIVLNEDIDFCFSALSMEEIISRLQKARHPACIEALTLLKKVSPTSLKVTLKALHISQTLEFNECMDNEFRLAQRFLTGHDFKEGIRALIIDKDQAPHWQPATLAAVSENRVASYFTPADQDLTL